MKKKTKRPRITKQDILDLIEFLVPPKKEESYEEYRAPVIPDRYELNPAGWLERVPVALNERGWLDYDYQYR